MTTQRDQHLQQMHNRELDVLIVGGGINGAVSAAALSSKGLTVGLIDKGDYANFCSSNSSNLIWGGIKYLENHEYLLVNKLCKSRNHLMRHYPSTVKEIRFLTTIQKGFRLPAWFIYLGTILYWAIGRFFTQAPTFLSTKDIQKNEPSININNVDGGFEYSDAYLESNDARFVFSFIHTAIKQGASVANYVESLGSIQKNGRWITRAVDKTTGKQLTFSSQLLVNACGPMVDQHNDVSAQKTQHHHLFSKGVHLIVDKIQQQCKTLAFFASDGRLFFVIPMGNKTCIGTTDTQVSSPTTEVTDDDRKFILDNINNLLNLKKPLTHNDIISERCGVRPLAIKAKHGIANWIQLSRKHVIEVNKKEKHISIFGGKLTDCINIGKEMIAVAQQLSMPIKNHRKRWYGEPEDAIKNTFFTQALKIELDKHTSKNSSEPLSQRFWRRYGEAAFELLEHTIENPEKAQIALEYTEFTWAEIDWIADNEMVVELEDLLRRRSKVSLIVRPEQLAYAEGLETVCQRLFGDHAEQKLNHFRATLQQVNVSHHQKNGSNGYVQ